MSTSDSSPESVMPSAQENQGPPSIPIVDCDRSLWKAISQRAADLYDSGAKLWRKSDLADIEQQLAEFQVRDSFTIRRIDGSLVKLKNPMFGVQRPIWRPTVEFQEYWNLVQTRPHGPPETYNCSYLVHWHNPTEQNFRGLIPTSRPMFQAARQFWDRSEACAAFKALIRDVVRTRKVTKVVCFGLGDMTRKTAVWWKLEAGESAADVETADKHGSFVQHAVALTMVDAIRSKTGDTVRLLAQDPGYTDDAKEMLRESGFEIVGEFGAGGFAEVDETSMVLSAFPAAPVKQIIADIARPVLIITVGPTGSVMDQDDDPVGDPESPRTTQMWRGYGGASFLISPNEVHLELALRGLDIFIRNITDVANVSEGGEQSAGGEQSEGVE